LNGFSGGKQSEGDLQSMVFKRFFFAYPKKTTDTTPFEVETRARPTTRSFPKNLVIRYAKRYPTHGKWK